MLVLISPAKTLDFNRNISSEIIKSTPYFYKEADQLVQVLKKYSVEDLSKLMKLSNKLSELNWCRFQDYSKSDSRQAIYTYNGDVYEGFELSEYNQDIQEFSNKTLRIISGLYGVLKPFDLIKAYRLEMSTPLSSSYGRNLYEFWGDKITNYLNKDHGEVIINLSSKEYSLSINPVKLNKRIINITFKERYKDGYKIIGLHAKKARGVMANFIIINQITNPFKLKEFNLNGYQYSSELSSEDEYVFVR